MLLYLILNVANASAQSIPYTNGEWVMVFNDEFNDPVLDPLKWIVEDGIHYNNLNIYGSPFMDDHSAYTREENLELVYDPLAGSGVLKFKTTNHNPPVYLPYDEDDNGLIYAHYGWTSAGIKSRAKFLYGAFEIRCKTPVGKGFWPAFWLYDEESKDADGNKVGWQEIDFFEMNGVVTDRWTSSVHWDPSGADDHDWKTNQYDLDGDVPVFCEVSNVNSPNSNHLHEDYHVFRGYWIEDGVIFSIDGQEYWHFFPSSQSKIPDSNMDLRIGVGVSFNPDDYDCRNNWWPGVDATTPPYGEMAVDYVRVWKFLECASEVDECNYTKDRLHDPAYVLADYITYGGANCNTSVTHDATSPWTPSWNHIGDGEPFYHYAGEQNWHLRAKNEIKLEPGVYLQRGNYVTAKLVDAGCDGDLPLATTIGQGGEVLITPDHVPISSERVEQNTNLSAITFEVIPNPNSGEFTLAIEGMTGSYDVQVVDMVGKEVFVQRNNVGSRLKMDISEQSKGIYFVRIQAQDEAHVVKIIKQ